MGERVPVTIVAGFLGSGKTTLLRRFVLSQVSVGASASGVRTGALINDFGALGLDHELVATVADASTPVLELSNGCVCCSINGDLCRAIETVLDLTPAVGHILIETTGLADPLPIVASLTRTALRSRVRVDAVVTLVDAPSFDEAVAQTDVAQAQIAAADVVIINKVDQVTHEWVNALEGRLRVRWGSKRILRATHAEVDLSLLTGIGRFDLLGSEEDESFVAWERRPPGVTDHLRRDGFRAVAVAVPARLDEKAFQRFLWNEIPSTVYRGKGLVCLGVSGIPYVFHRVGDRTTFDPWPRPVARPRAVFLGRLDDGDERLLRDAIVRCARSDASTEEAS